MRYKKDLAGSYAYCDVHLLNEVGGSHGKEFQAEIIFYDNGVPFYDDGYFIIRDKKSDHPYSWVSDDNLTIWGKFVGTEIFERTNALTDKTVDHEIPVIEVYYDELLWLGTQ